MTRQPDWLTELRAPDVSPEGRWYPFLTLLQLTVDQFFGVSVPVGHGHNYGSIVAGVWENVVPAPQWTPAARAALQPVIDGYRSNSESGPVCRCGLRGPDARGSLRLLPTIEGSP